LRLLDERLTRGVTERDEPEVKDALVTIRDQAPSLISDLGDTLTNIAYGVSGNYVFQWLQALAINLR
jgi:hypothetical protein